MFRKKILFILLASALSAVLASLPQAQAQMLIAPQLTAGTDQLQVSPALVFSSVDYHFDGGGSTTIDRQIIGASAAYGLLRELDVYGEAGYSFNSKLQDAGDNDGYVLGTGFRGILFEQNALSVHGLAGFRFIAERFDAGVDARVIEVPLSVVVRGKVNRELGVYGGIDVIPYTGGDIDFKVGKRDIEREDFAGLRLGADYKMDGLITFNGEVSLISEESFMLRMAFPL